LNPCRKPAFSPIVPFQQFQQSEAPIQPKVAQNAKRAEIIAKELPEVEKLLIELRRDKNMPWKDISKEIEERLGKRVSSVGKRLKERLKNSKEILSAYTSK